MSHLTQFRAESEGKVSEKNPSSTGPLNPLLSHFFRRGSDSFALPIVDDTTLFRQRNAR